MFLILWLTIGTVVGLIINVIAERRKPALAAGVVADVILGAFGASIGGFVLTISGGRGASEINLWSLPCAAMGALFILAGFRALRRTGLGFL